MTAPLAARATRRVGPGFTLALALSACSTSHTPDAVALDAAPAPDSSKPDTSVPDAGQPTSDARHDTGVPDQVPPGCDPDRVAVAMHPGGEVLASQPAGAPYTCANGTDQRAPFNASLVVTDEGTVVYAPSHATGVIRSTDEGATFSAPLNDPPPEEDADWFHPYVARDPDSGRLFFNVYRSFEGPCLLGTGSEYWYSDDDGATWTSVEGGVGCDSWDWGKVIVGPPATEESRAILDQAGYPNVVYFCAGGMVYALGTHHYCYRSLDGGLTYQRAGNAVDPIRGQAGWPNAGAIAPDGAFYKVHGSAGSGVRVAISEDEAQNWRVTTIPDTALGIVPSISFLAANVATDSEGNVYVVWVDDRDTLPYLSISRDRAETWSAPMMVGAPEVRVATNINIAVKRPGYVAIDYYGSAQAEAVGGDGYWDSDGRPYNAYLTVTDDVFAASPTFWSTSINDPEAPTVTGIDVYVSEYIGAPAFGPDGDIWAGFLHEDEGLVGRMVGPPP